MNNKRKFKSVAIPIPADPMTITQVVSALVFGLGLLGYVIGDIRQPPAPVPTADVIVVTATPIASTPTQLPMPTAMPTQIIWPTITPVPLQPVAAVQQPISQEPVMVSQEPVTQPVVAAAPAVNTDLAYIQQAMSSRTIPPVDEATCNTYAEHKMENGICYIRGPLDAPGVWVAIGVEYPGFSCERSLFPGVSGSYDDASKTCTVTYNQTTTRWSWTGSSWTLVG